MHDPQSQNSWHNADMHFGGAMTVADADPQIRTDFLHRTYQHLALAIAAFVGVEFLLFQIPNIDVLAAKMVSGYAWLVVLGLFMVVSNVANKWAHSNISVERQYLGLGLYVVAEAILFLPLLYIAAFYTDGSVIPSAALITGIVFGGLTATVLITKKDLTFLGGILRIAGFAALGLIVASFVFGLNLGVIFSAAMVVFAAGAIAYETSNMVHHYRPDQHVAAALGLFASVALLFWYVINLLMSARD